MKRILSLVLITIMTILPSCGTKDIASTPETKKVVESILETTVPQTTMQQTTTAETENETTLETTKESNIEKVLENNNGGNNMKSVVYFTKDITADSLVKIYEKLGWTPTGKVGVKISTGEPPRSNYLRADLIGDLVKKVDGTIIECNTAYGGPRSETAMHK